MIQLTKVFHFEMAHAIHGYPGACKNIHGHSFKLEVTIASADSNIPESGIIIDFKEIKRLVKKTVVEKFDHKLLLSRNFLLTHPAFSSLENLVITDNEPTAENLLANISTIVSKELSDNLNLIKLKLHETKDSFAEWINDEAIHQ